MKRITIALLMALCTMASAFAADHVEAPLAIAHPSTDICDFYAWTKGDRLVMALTVNPFYTGSGPLFDRSARYNFWVDSDMDAWPDQSLRIDFGGLGNMIVGGSLKRHVRQIWSGAREDPFFFDLGLLGAGLNGSDTFAGADVAAIVVEFDIADLTTNGSQIGLWVTTAKQGIGQLDRMGRPVINTLFIPEGMKDAFNQARPSADMRDYGTLIPLPDVLTPDILTIDTAQPTAYPNGRALADDAIDISLGLVFGEGTDNVAANDVPFLGVFPYLAPPNSAAKSAAEASVASLPADFALGRAHPNPFNPSTEIPFELARDGLVRLEVYNLAGQRVRSLVDGTRQAGTYAINWDARDDQGRDVASGIYLYRLSFSGGPGRAGFSASRRVTLLR